MGQGLHGSARTTAAVRRAIQHSQESLRVLARRHGINPKTVAKWKSRASVADRPTGPKQPKSTVLTLEEEAIVVAFRRHTLLPLDDCLNQPVDEVLVQSGRRSKRMFTTIRAGMALWARRTIRMAASAAPSLIGSRISTHQPRATASFGVPAPINRRISSPRLCPATWIR